MHADSAHNRVLESTTARPATAVPVMLWIDSEPDKPFPKLTDRSDWAGLERCIAELATYRERLGAATGSEASFNWAVRADPQLTEVYGDSAWGLRRYASAWHEFLERGDDVGLHPHAQRWEGDAEGWIARHEEPEWTAHVLEVAHRDYRRVLGCDPLTLRFGNRHMSQELARLAGKLGFRHDCSVEPGFPGRNARSRRYRLAGFCPSYFDAPREPYRAAQHDFLTPDPQNPSGLWLVPMSAAPVNPDVPLSREPYHRAVSPAINCYEPMLLTLAPERFTGAVDHLLRELDRPYLALVFRSSMLHQPEVRANLEALCARARAWRLAFTTTAGALRLLGYERDTAPPRPAHIGVR